MVDGPHLKVTMEARIVDQYIATINGVTCEEYECPTPQEVDEKKV
jgi:hypothetical protein